MAQDFNIARAYQRIAEATPDHPALIFPDQVYTHAQMWRLTKAFAARMREGEVDRTSTVCVTIKDASVVLATAFGTAMLGAQFVQQSGELEMSAALPVTHWLRERPDDSNGANLVVDERWSPAVVDSEGMNQSDFDGYADPEDPWLYIHTSGTTGYPKFLALSQRIFHSRCVAYAADFGNGQARICLLFSHLSRPFLSRALGALLNGSALVVGEDPEFWQKAGVTIVSASPAIASAKLGATKLPKKLPTIEILGSNMEDSLAIHLLESFERIDHAYGASETNKTFSNLLTLDASGNLEAIGRPRDSIIEIVDQSGVLALSGAEGVVRVKNGYLAKGYLSDEDAANVAFRDGWFYPGDIARWGSNGTLQVLRRDDDVINIGGIKVHAMAVDLTMKSVGGVVDAACFRNPKEGAKPELFAFVVYEEGANKLQTAASIRYFCAEKLGQALVPRVIREVEGLPRLQDGQPDRETCAQQVLSVARRMQEQPPQPQKSI